MRQSKRQARSCATFRPCLRTLITVAVAVLPGTLLAQQASSSEQSTALGPTLPVTQKLPHLCLVSAQPIANSSSVNLSGLCWGTALPLGRADRYATVVNTALRATVVTIERLGTAQVLLLRANDQDVPVIEDITSVVAQGAGRGPWARIDDLELDLSGFAKSGRLKAKARAAVSREQSRTTAAREPQPAAPTGVAVDIDLVAHVEAERQRANGARGIAQ